MKEAVLTNGTSEPNLDETEVKYQCALQLRCAAALKFPPLTIVVTLPIISHTMSVGGLKQITVMEFWMSHLCYNHMCCGRYSG